MQAVKNLFNKDLFAKNLGMEVVSAREGTATVRMTVCPQCCNGLGYCHGSVLFGMADLALAAAANSRGQVAVSLSAAINWVANVKSGALLEATAKEISVTRRTAVYAIEVRDTADGKILAAVQGTCYRKEEKVPGFPETTLP